MYKTIYYLWKSEQFKERYLNCIHELKKCYTNFFVVNDIYYVDWPILIEKFITAIKLKSQLLPHFFAGLLEKNLTVYFKNHLYHWKVKFEEIVNFLISLLKLHLQLGWPFELSLLTIPSFLPSVNTSRILLCIKVLC